MSRTKKQQGERRRIDTCIYYDPRNKERPIEVKVTVKGKKPFIEYFGENELKKAKEFRARAYNERANGKTLAKQNPTFKEYAKRYYETKRNIDERSETSDKTTWSALNINVFPYIGDMDITKIKVSDIKDMQNEWYKKKRPLKYSSGNTIMSQISAVFNGALTDAIIHDNPVKRVRKPKNDSPEKMALEQKEVNKILAYCRNISNNRCMYLAMFLMFNAGLRSGELRGLTWNKVQYRIVDNEKVGVIVVDTQWSDPLKKHTKPKTSDSNREVPLPMQFMEELEKYREDNNAYIVHRNRKPFVPISSTGLEGYCELIEKNTGIKFTPHTCRHTYASLMILEGADLYYLAKFLGHSNVNMIMKTYAHLLQKGIQKFLKCFPKNIPLFEENKKFIA